MAQDKIIIKDLLLRGIIGLNDWEREKPQDILINLTLFTDMRAAGPCRHVDNPAANLKSDLFEPGFLFRT